MNRRLRVALSTCPNDTFAFHALLAGEVKAPGLDLDFELGDVEELNLRMLAGELDISKVSFHAALAMGEAVQILPSGSALGFGVGPVLLARPGWRSASELRVLTPGRWTTARLLYGLFHAEPASLEDRVFHAIMPALGKGEADLGVCIHEGRFTWQEHGLELVEDLGERWEKHTDSPLPLGGIAASTRIGDDAQRFQDALAASIRWARANPEATLGSMRRYAQEANDDVLWKHVELYVNAETEALSAVGVRALEQLEAQARSRQLPGLVGLPPVLGFS